MKNLLKLFKPDFKKQQAEIEKQAKLNYQNSPAGMAAGYEEDDLIDEAEQERLYKLKALKRLTE